MTYVATAFDYQSGAPTPPYRSHLFVSADGIAWTPFGDLPTDPMQNQSLLYHRDAWWLVGAAMLTEGQEQPDWFNLYRSADLVTWSAVQQVSTGGAANRTCAPVWFVDDDGSVHVILSIAPTTVQATFWLAEIHPLDADMTTWSDPVLFTGTGLDAPSWDPAMIRDGDTYRVIYSHNGYNELASSSSMTSGWTVTKTGDWAGWYALGGYMEGASLVPATSGWRLYICFAYSNEVQPYGLIYYTETTDPTLASGWSEPVACTGLESMSHPIVTLPAIPADYFATTRVALDNGLSLVTESGQRVLRDVLP